MTTKTTRAALAALLLATSGLTLSQAAFAQNERAIGEAESRAGRQNQPAAATRKPGTGPTLSAETGRVLAAVQKLVIDKKYPEAMAALKAAKPPTSDYDKLKTYEFTTIVAFNLGDEAAAAAAAEAAADLPPDSIPPEDKEPIYLRAAQLANNAKHYDKALVYARHLIELGSSTPGAIQTISVVMYTAAPPAEAAAYLQKRIDTAVAAGQRPSRDLIDMKINAHLKANDNPGAEATLEQSLLLFNEPKDWEQMINVAITTQGIREIDAINMGRLLFTSGAPVSADNALLVGETAQKLGMYGDAQQAQQKGAKLTLDTARINSDKASMPEQIKVGSAQNGVYNVKLSEALYGYGMYPEAEAAARLALTKGGIDASEAQMLIGMSLFQQGKYAEAQQAFGQVQGGGPATPRVARLWTTLTKIKQTPPK